MNWQDTVLTDEQMAKALDTSRDEFWDSLPLVVDYPTTRAVQAETSFKAGMREVVEWIERNELDICGYTGSKGSIKESEPWKAFKKEKGL